MSGGGGGGGARSVYIYKSNSNMFCHHKKG